MRQVKPISSKLLLTLTALLLLSVTSKAATGVSVSIHSLPLLTESEAPPELSEGCEGAGVRGCEGARLPPTLSSRSAIFTTS